MNVLPKCLYIFQSVPLPPPSSFFSSITKLISKFIWNNRKPRLRLSLLYLPYESGGLKLPNFQYYYWAAQLRAAVYWFSKDSVPSWINIELASAGGLSLDNFLYSAPLKKLKKVPNPLVRNTIQIWFETHKYMKDTPLLSYLSPIWKNSNFPPASNDGGFKIWFTKGITKIGSLYKRKNMLSWEELKRDYDLPRSHFLKFLQIRSFITSVLKSTAQPKLSRQEDFFCSDCGDRHLVSKIYKILLDNHRDNTEIIRHRWSNDLGKDITEETWQRICVKAQTQTINSKLRLLQYKWITRTYITPEKNPQI